MARCRSAPANLYRRQHRSLSWRSGEIYSDRTTCLRHAERFQLLGISGSLARTNRVSFQFAKHEFGSSAHREPLKRATVWRNLGKNPAGYSRWGGVGSADCWSSAEITLNCSPQDRVERRRL